MQILNGNNLDLLKTLPDNSVDSVVTDPPYGLSFMNKKWDYDVPSVELWKEVYRVLKHGGHVVSFGGTRTYHRMVVNIEDAGFEIRDQIMWLYGSGFPKSLNIGKAIDKKQGIISHSVLELKQIIIDYFNKSGLKKNEFDKLCGFRAANYMRTESRDDDGWGEAIPSNEKWLKIKEILNIDTNEYDELFQSAIRDVIGKGSSGIGKAFTKDGWHSETMEFDITEAKNQAAKNWEGWGTALKPANEPICLARKPLSEKSIAENVLKYGTGGINIDGCRVGSENRTYKGSGKQPNKLNNHEKGATGIGYMDGSGSDLEYSVNGRFPANIIHDGSEEVLNEFPDNKGAFAPVKKGQKGFGGDIYGKYAQAGDDGKTFYNDGLGSASRFFYCAKASKTDRGSANNHPTVKPTDLMRYLCRLITPPKGIVLDPFMGSGSTGKGAILEGFDFIGMELDPEYVEIAKARIEHAQNEYTERQAQQKLF
jgi:DNA modification methylase